VRIAWFGQDDTCQALESRLGAVRFCPDEWMDALSLNLWDEEKRGRIETLQWKLGQELLARGLTVIIEWGTWEGPSGMRCASEREPSAPPLSCIIFLSLWMFFSRGFNAEVWKSRR